MGKRGIQLIWLAPLLAYLWAAAHIALFVPCVWQAPLYGGGVRTIGRTLWLPDVTTQSVRWGLVCYKEALALAALAVIYAGLFAASKRFAFKVFRRS